MILVVILSKLAMSELLLKHSRKVSTKQMMIWISYAQSAHNRCHLWYW